MCIKACMRVTGETGGSGSHGNGVSGIDHLVIRTSDWRSTSDGLAAIGFSPKHQTSAVRRGVAQLFYRAEEQPSPVIEVVGPTEPLGGAGKRDGHARIWGITFVCGDLEQTHEKLRSW